MKLLYSEFRSESILINIVHIGNKFYHKYEISGQ